LQDGQVSQNHQANAQPGDGALRFLAPDALLAQRPHADLLIVDEAAGIPAPLLEQMLSAYPRICFATTVHGYEGTGRGFEVRFRALLDQHTPNWRALRLSAPIRWRPGDPLEVLTAQALLLDAEPASDERITAADFGADLSAVRVARPARAQLAADEARLRQVFGLLVLGHYQTRPNDLRHLLDGPNLAVTTLEVDQQVVATALLAQEGALDSALHWPIFAGQRRPRGHLLPQTLCAHAGLSEAPGLRYLRIVRIAVHPAARRRGLGRRLLAAIAEHAAEAGVDLLGASFGATPELLAFWRHAGLRPLHLGTHRNAASGTRAAVVLKPLSQAGRMLCAQAEQRLQRDLPLLLSGPLREVEPALVAALLQALPAAPAPPETAADHATIVAFADAHRTLEASLPALARLSWRALTGADAERACSAAQRALLIRVLLQRQPPAAAAQQAGLSGHAELIAHLRQAVGAASRHLGAAL
jgi:tRNA(Met) cytidine acetyltransferase